MSESKENNANEPHKEDAWWRRIIKAFGIEAPVMMLMGVVIGILLSYIFIISKPDIFIQPLIAHAVRETVAVQPTQSPMPTYTPYTLLMPTTEPTQLPTQTSTITPVPNIYIETMDTIADWGSNGNGVGVLGLVDGLRNKAIEISYTLKENEYVGIAKPLIPCQLFGGKGIQFSYRGSGAVNTIELKLIYTPDQSGQEAVFGWIQYHSTETDGEWVTIEVPYTGFKCWAGTGCRVEDMLDISKVQRIDFAISNKPDKNDIPGVGIVLLDEVQIFK